MKPHSAQAFLNQSLAELAEARRHLDYSFQQIETLSSHLVDLTESQLESVDAFTSRFARSIDLLVNKVLRSLDRVEMKNEGTLLDTVNRAEKRGFIARAEQLRELKDARNMIAHDYAGEKMDEIFNYCRTQKPSFDSICDRVTAYVKQMPG